MNRIFQSVYFVAYRLAKAYWFFRRPESRGAHIAIWVDDKLLVIRNSYRSEFTLVCGGINRGETPASAAVREIREEIGLSFTEDQLEPIGTLTSDREYKNDTCHMYEIRLSTHPTITLDNREVVDYQFATLPELNAITKVDILEQYLKRFD